jgi:predicted  nucleic acid-binding Zn-ribbon protein
MKLIFLNEAMELCGATDPKAFKANVKKHHCLYERAGIAKVDVEKFQSVLDAEFSAMADAAKNRKAIKDTAGKQLGLVRARLAQYEKRMAKKQTKIAAAEKAVADAKDRYSRTKAEAEVAKLRREYDNLVAGKARDEQLLDELLNGGDPESNS